MIDTSITKCHPFPSLEQAIAICKICKENEIQIPSAASMTRRTSTWYVATEGNEIVGFLHLDNASKAIEDVQTWSYARHAKQYLLEEVNATF